MNKEVQEILNVRRKMAILEYARLIGSATKACE